MHHMYIAGILTCVVALDVATGIAPLIGNWVSKLSVTWAPSFFFCFFTGEINSIRRIHWVALVQHQIHEHDNKRKQLT